MARLRHVLLTVWLFGNTFGCHREPRKAEAPPPPPRREAHVPLALAAPIDVPVPTGRLSGAFAVSHDGGTLAFGASDGSILLVPALGGKARVLAGHTAPVSVAAFTRDGQTLVSGGADRHVIVWDLGSNQPRCDLTAHTGEVKALAVSPDGTLAATGSVADDVKVWRIRDGTLAQHFGGTPAAIYDLTFSPTGQQVYSASRDSQVRRWSLDKGKLHGMPLSFANSLVALRWSPDRATLFVADLQGMVFWLDAAELKEVHRRRVSSQPIVALDVAPDGTLVVGDAAGQLGLWSPILKHEAPIVAPFAAHEGAVRALRVMPGGASYLSLGEDGRLLRWGLDAGSPAGTAPAIPPINGVVRAVAAHPKGSQIAIASGGRLFVSGGRAALPAGPDLGPGGVSAVAWSHGGERLLVGRDTGVVRVLAGAAPWGPTGDHPVHRGAVRAIQPSGDGRTVWTAGDDNAVHELDASTFSVLRTYTDHSSPIVSLAVDPTGRRIASSEEEHITFVRDVDGEVIEWSLRREGLSALAFSPDGAVLAAVQKNTTVALFDVATRKRLRTLDGKGGVIGAVAFHTGGTAVATLDMTGVLRLFGLDGVEVASGAATRGRATALSIGDDGRAIVVGGTDPTGSVKVFRVR